MNIGEQLFGTHAGENREEALERIETNKRIFQEALDSEPGRRLLGLLTSVSHPMEPRGFDGNTHQAAFRDGEKHLIGLMWLNGTNDKTLPSYDG